MLTRFDPLASFDQISNELLGALSRRAYQHAHGRLPPRGQLGRQVDLPGVDAGSIDLTVDRNVLRIEASRNWQPAEGDLVLAAERPRGNFSRQLMLSEDIDSGAIKADYRDGVLTVVLPVAETAKPKKVAIGTSGAGARTVVEAQSDPAPGRLSRRRPARSPRDRAGGQVRSLNIHRRRPARTGPAFSFGTTPIDYSRRTCPPLSPWSNKPAALTHSSAPGQAVTGGAVKDLGRRATGARLKELGRSWCDACRCVPTTSKPPPPSAQSTRPWPPWGGTTPTAGSTGASPEARRLLTSAGGPPPPSKVRMLTPRSESSASSSPGELTSEASPPAPARSRPVAALTAALASTVPARRAARPLAPRMTTSASPLRRPRTSTRTAPTVPSG